MGGGNTKRDPGRGGGANTKINRGGGSEHEDTWEGHEERSGGGGRVTKWARQYFKYIAIHSNHVFNVYLNTKIDWRLQLIRINR